MNFVAIDFETANEKRNSACSLGITVVENNEIKEEKYFLIKPCENRFLPMNIWIHGITPEQIKNEKEFYEIWDEIKSYIEGKFVIAHNAAFDISVLRKTLDFYGIEYPEFKYGCTVVMAKNYYVDLPNHKLNTVNDALGYSFKHHNAAADASAAANILMNICKDTKINNIKELSDTIGVRIGKVYKDGYSPSGSLGRSRVTKKLFANYDENIENRNGFFCDKIVVFTGPLNSMSRAEAMKRVIACGGTIGSSVTKKTNYIVTGIKSINTLTYENKSFKLKKAEKLMREGQKIEILNEEKFLELL